MSSTQLNPQDRMDSWHNLTSDGKVQYTKHMGVLYVRLDGYAAAPAGSYVILGVLPEGYRPKKVEYVVIPGYSTVMGKISIFYEDGRFGIRTSDSEPSYTIISLIL